MTADRYQRHGDAQAGFAGASAANEDRVAFGNQEGAGGELADQALVDRGVSKNELVEVLEDRELGPCGAIADEASLTVRSLGARALTAASMWGPRSKCVSPLRQHRVPSANPI